MRMIPLAASTFFMVSGGPYAIEDILGGAGYLKALLILLILPVIWSLPTALMIGELASAIPAEGGFYVWVRRALGPFWGYQEAWLSLTASVFDMAIYPAFAVLYLGKLFPALTTGHRSMVWSLLIVVICVLWNLRGAPSVGGGSVWLFGLLLAPFAVLVAAALWHARHTVHAQGHLGAPPGANLSTAILVALWNYMGWDNASTVAREVENPQRNYPRAMALSTTMVAITYIVPIVAVALAGISVAQFSTGSWTDAAQSLCGHGLFIAIVVGGVISGVGMFNVLMMSYARLPMALAQDRMLPSWMARTNRRGVPVAAIMACGAAWALALNFTFERLISLDLILYGASLILEFIALAVLRKKEPDLVRPFRIKGRGMAMLVGIPPTALILFAMYVARTERVGRMPALLFGLIIAAAGPCFYWLSRRFWGTHGPGTSEELSEGVDGHSCRANQ
ncbi:MAG TPA: APC family permease [Acidisarcina sp.]